MKYSRCVEIIQKNESKSLILKAIQSLKKQEKQEKDREIKKNLRNWAKIGEARLTPNRLSSIKVIDEISIRDFLFDNPKRIEKGLDIICKEFDLRIGKVDLLGKDKNGKFVIIEIKGGKAIGQAIGQLMSYLFAFEFYFKKEARGILIAPSFHSQAFGAFEFLKRAGIKNIELKYLNGIEAVFKKEKFELTKFRRLSRKQQDIWQQIKM